MVLTKDKIDAVNIEELVESHSHSNQIESLLIIVPTNRKLRDLKKKIISNFNNQPVSQINIETLTTLSYKLLKQHKNFTTLSEAAATILIKESANELKLHYFAAYTNGIPFGTLDKIKNVISQYKQHGISPERLSEESEKLEEGEKKKAKDIAAIYNKYLAKCDDLSALEIGDIYRELLTINSNTLTKYFNNSFSNVETVIVNGFDNFTIPEMEILSSLSEIVDSKLYINFDYYQYNENLFSHLDETYSKLVDYGFDKVIDLSPEDDLGFNKIIKRNLFKKNENEKLNQFSNKIFRVKPKNRLAEIEFIAKTIKILVQRENVNPGKICVSFNVVGNYSGKVRDTFKKYGVPLNLTDRIQLKSAPPVVAAISMLELLEGDFYYNDIARILTNHFLEFDGIDLNNLLKVASELKIKTGKSNWDVTIQDALNLLNYNKNLTNEEKLKIQQKYSKAKDDINQLYQLLKPFRTKSSSTNFLSNFKKLLLKLKLPCFVLENSNGKEEEHIKAVTVLFQTLTEVLGLINKSEVDTKEYHLGFFLDQIRTITNWARFNVKEKSDYGVLVTSINEIRGLSFDYLFLGGMCDGDFPTKYSPEIFFSGSYVKKEQIHQTEERYHFYQTLSAWKKKLYLTIPQRDNDSELVESVFIKDFEKLLIMTELNTNYSDEILSIDELMKVFGKDISNKELENNISELGFNLNKIQTVSSVREYRIANPFDENTHNGYIASDVKEIKSFLTNNSEKEFSVSQLETFAKCPFKYFSERILKIKPIDEPTEEAEPIELGNVLHSILYEFYSKVVSEKVTLDKQGTKDFENLEKILFEIAEEKINLLKLNSPLAFFEKEKILGIDGKRENSILYKFLLSETESDTSFQPSFFEFSFGNFSNNQIKQEIHIPPLMINKLKLRGTVDRIDINEEEKAFNVIDYKLKGAKPTNKDLFEGLSLQLPVYLMAGEYILENIKGQKFEGNEMSIYSLNYNDKKFGSTPIKLTKKKASKELTKELNDNLVENTREKLTEYHNDIVSGKFNLSKFDDRESKVCRYCDFKSFCRVKEIFE